MENMPVVSYVRVARRRAEQIPTQQLERDIFTSSHLSPLYLFYDGPSVLPLLEAVARHGVDSLRVARIKLSHLLVQEALKRQLLIFVLDVVPCLHLAEGAEGGRNHTSGDPRQ